MTLFIGRCTESTIELGADGLSISTALAGQPGRTTLQKVFPAPDRPIAIAHVGTNVLRIDGHNRSFGSVADEFFRSIRGRPSLSMKDVAELFAKQHACKQLSPDVVIRLVGFTPNDPCPEFYVIKQDRLNEPVITAENWVGSTIVDGSGAQYIDSLRLPMKSIFHRAVERERACKPPTFGGHWHSVRIRSGESPAWSESPSFGTLGIVELLPNRVMGEGFHSDESPQELIKLQIAQLRKELGLRTLLPKGKRAKTITGIEENWLHPQDQPDWLLVRRLIAIGDEAEIARPTDIAVDEAVLVASNVVDLTNSLPPPIHC